MNGLQRAIFNTAVMAVTRAYYSVLNRTFLDLKSSGKYGKADTLGIDAIPEIAIKDQINSFDPTAIIVTEETDDKISDRWPDTSDPRSQPNVWFCDPTDRSKFFQALILKLMGQTDNHQTVREVFRHINVKEVWKEIGGEPATITGATTSLSCVSQGKILFSVIVNYITGELIAASDAGIVQIKIPEEIQRADEKFDIDCIYAKGKQINFPQMNGSKNADCMRFVTYLGKSGYQENFLDSGIFVEGADRYLYDSEPGGPSRVLFLSHLQRKIKTIGFTLANGEKISEWIPWLAFIKYAKNGHGNKALRAFEISHKRPWTKEGILMSTASCYSIFNMETEEGFLDVTQLKRMRKPSHFRAMIVVTPADNADIITIMSRYQYREITSCF